MYLINRKKKKNKLNYWRKEENVLNYWRNEEKCT